MSQFTDALHHLREVLISQPRVNFSNQSPSVVRSAVSLLGTKRTSGLSSTTLPVGGAGGGAMGGAKELAVPGSGNAVQSLLASSGERGSAMAALTGVSLHQVDQITASLREFGSRISQVTEIASTLAQFHSLTHQLRGLPRVSGLWAVEPPLIVVAGETSFDGANKRVTPIPEGSVTASDYLEQVFGKNEYPLLPLERKGESKGLVSVCGCVLCEHNIICLLVYRETPPRNLRPHPLLLLTTPISLVHRHQILQAVSLLTSAQD